MCTEPKVKSIELQVTDGLSSFELWKILLVDCKYGYNFEEYPCGVITVKYIFYTIEDYNSTPISFAAVTKEQ